MASAREIALRRPWPRVPASALELLSPLEREEARAQQHRLEAERRAETLLGECLTDAEWDQLIQHGYLEVASPSRSGRRYRIPRGGGRLLLRERNGTVVELCVGPAGYLPGPDVILVHLLMIRGDERHLLATANRFPVPSARW